MKKFKFKLEAVLKLRGFEEDRAKVELGRVTQLIQKRKEKISEIQNNIGKEFETQEKMLKMGTKAAHSQLFPNAYLGKIRMIEKIQNEIFALQKEYELRLEEYQEARAKLKLMTKFKEKSLEKFKVESLRKMQKEIDDSTIMKEYFKKKDVA